MMCEIAFISLGPMLSGPADFEILRFWIISVISYSSIDSQYILLICGLQYCLKVLLLLLLLVTQFWESDFASVSPRLWKYLLNSLQIDWGSLMLSLFILSMGTVYLVFLLFPS